MYPIPCLSGIKSAFLERLLNNNEISELWRPLENEFLEIFCKNYFWTVPDFLNSSQIQILLNHALLTEEMGLLKRAAIGKGDMKTRDESIRSDKIHWLDQYNTPAGQLAQQVFEGLLGLARKKLFLPARRFECHFAKYENGDAYLRHSDRHSFLPGRLLTCVIYLSDLEGNHGGELVLYDEDLRPIKITPSPGRIVVFDSGLEHEVRPTRQTRWSLTGWLREDLHPGIRF